MILPVLFLRVSKCPFSLIPFLKLCILRCHPELLHNRIIESIFLVTVVRLVFFSDHGSPNRERNRHDIIRTHADPGIGAARSGARFEVYGAVLDAGEYVHDVRLHDHALLHFQ